VVLMGMKKKLFAAARGPDACDVDKASRRVNLFSTISHLLVVSIG
jgi:hypothetical protein